MHLLADENFPGPVVELLRSRGHDVLWARTHCASFSDKRLLGRAEDESRLLLTLDKDFWQIAMQRPAGLLRSGLILFRVHPAIPANVEPLVLRVLSMDQMWQGYLAVATLEGVHLVRSMSPWLEGEER